MRDLARLLRSEYLLCRMITASMAGSRSCSSMNSATVMASCGLWPRPPPASTVKPALPPRRVATRPRSWIRPWAQSASQPEKLTLNLRGIC